MFEISEISVTYKPAFKFSERPKVNDSADVANIFRSIWSDKINYCEEFLIMLLNRGNRILGVSKIGLGGTAGVVVDPKIIFQIALKTHASSIILCHNHPSGTLKPSQADIQVTNKIKGVGEMLDLNVLDHLIITEDGFYSFADEGMM